LACPTRSEQETKDGKRDKRQESLQQHGDR